MRRSDLSSHPDRTTLRRFSGLWLAVFGGMAAWQGLARGYHRLGLALAVAAAVVGPLGLVAPGAVRPFYRGWRALTFPIGWATSRLILAAVYYGVITPVGLAFRAIGRDPLARRFEPGRPSYWTPRPVSDDLRRYFRPS